MEHQLLPRKTKPSWAQTWSKAAATSLPRPGCPWVLQHAQDLCSVNQECSEALWCPDALSFSCTFYA